MGDQLGRDLSSTPEPAPASVTYALWCFAVALLIGAAILAIPWGYPLIALLTLLTIGFLIVHSGRRHNWARWTLTVVTIGALIRTWPMLHFQLSYGLLIGAATAIQISLELLGCYLLFRSESGRWYRRHLTTPAA